MILWGALLLLPAGAAEPDPWPVEFEDPPDLVTADLDHDGVPDTRAEGGGGGSGWRFTNTCVRLGKSGHVACDATVSTPYSLFCGERRVLVPVTGNLAATYLAQDDCPPANPDDPAQGAMWALGRMPPQEGPFAPQAVWLPGPPVDQVSVCLTPQQASGLSGAFIWEGEGRAPEVIAGEGWRVYYSASWPVWIFDQKPRDRTPDEVATVGFMTIYRHGAALALYDPAHNRHTWLVNLAGDLQDGFKVDRWERFDRVSVEGTTVVIGGSDVIDGVGASLRLDLSALVVDPPPESR